jgi:hypothetical protein
MDKHQRQHVRTIISVAKAHEHQKPRGSRHAFRLSVLCAMTSMTEANLYVYASANVPASVHIEHQPVSWEPDGLGHDHASLGMYQQQTGTKWANTGTTTMTTEDGWGPPEVLMDPRQSTHLFIGALERKVPDWQTAPDLGVACQTVQGSAFPDRYEEQHHRAHFAVAAHYLTVRNPKESRPQHQAHSAHNALAPSSS